MKSLPDIIIVTNRACMRVFSYTEERLRQEDGYDFVDPTLRLSDIVTDQAGAFANPASAGTSAGENLPLMEERGRRQVRNVAARIESILAENDFPTWSLVAPTEIHAAIVAQLSKASRERLRIEVKKNLTHADVRQIEACLKRAMLPELK